MDEMTVKEQIRKIFSGGYNELHEFENDYNFAEQSALLGKLLDSYGEMNGQGRILLSEAVGDLLDSLYSVFGSVVLLLLKHTDKPEVVAVVRQRLQNPVFTAELLSAMLQSSKVCAEWVLQITEYSVKNSFERKSTTVPYKKLTKVIRKNLEILNRTPSE